MNEAVATILLEALKIADGLKRADTTTAEGLLAYLASRYPNDVERVLAEAAEPAAAE